MSLEEDEFAKMLDRINERDDDDIPEEHVPELLPQYMIFTSSLNVELVYVILKSIVKISCLDISSEDPRHS